MIGAENDNGINRGLVRQAINRANTSGRLPFFFVDSWTGYHFLVIPTINFIEALKKKNKNFVDFKRRAKNAQAEHTAQQLNNSNT